MARSEVETRGKTESHSPARSRTAVEPLVERLRPRSENRPAAKLGHVRRVDEWRTVWRRTTASSSTACASMPAVRATGDRSSQGVSASATPAAPANARIDAPRARFMPPRPDGSGNSHQCPPALISISVEKARTRTTGSRKIAV